MMATIPHDYFLRHFTSKQIYINLFLLASQKTKLTFQIKATDKYTAMKKCIYSIEFEFYTPPETLGKLMPMLFILIKYLALDSVPKHMINRSTMENYKNVIKKKQLLEWVITVI